MAKFSATFEAENSSHSSLAHTIICFYQGGDVTVTGAEEKALAKLHANTLSEKVVSKRKAELDPSTQYTSRCDLKKNKTNNNKRKKKMHNNHKKKRKTIIIIIIINEKSDS